MSDQVSNLQVHHETLNKIVTNLVESIQSLEILISSKSRIVAMQKQRIERGLLEQPLVDRFCVKIRNALLDPSNPHNAAFLCELEVSQTGQLEVFSPERCVALLEHVFDALPDLEDKMRLNIDELERQRNQQEEIREILDKYTEQERVAKEELDRLMLAQS